MSPRAHHATEAVAHMITQAAGGRRRRPSFQRSHNNGSCIMTSSARSIFAILGFTLLATSAVAQEHDVCAGLLTRAERHTVNT